ncbi:MAG: TolC family protein, partial [Verrucomicrobiota bacterium]
MKSFRVFSFFFFVALAAAAQTGTNSVAARPMSLPDCLQQALQQNFDVQIQRYNPQISVYDLRAAYGGYDPTFNISGQHNYDVSPSRFSTFTTNPTPATVSDENSFNSGLTGELPLSGLQYTLSGNISETYGNNGLPFDNSFGSIGVTLTQPL